MGSKKLSEQFIYDGTTTNEARPFDPIAEIAGPAFIDIGVIYISVSDGACTGLSANCDPVPKIQDKSLPKTIEVKKRFKIKHFDMCWLIYTVKNFYQF